MFGERRLFTLTFLSSSSSLHAVIDVATVVSTGDATVNVIAVVVNAVRATYRRAETVDEVVNTHNDVVGDHRAATEEDPTIDVTVRIVAGAAGRHWPETAARSLKLVDVDNCSSFVFYGKFLKDQNFFYFLDRRIS